MSHHRKLAAWALATALSSMSALAAAAPRPSDIAWHDDWRRVSTAENVATAAAFAVTGGLFLFGPDPPHNWRGGILFDDAVTDAVEQTGSNRNAVTRMSDVMYLGSVTYRALDDLVGAGAGYGAWDVASQMLMIDLQSYALVGAVLFSSQMFVGRERPMYRKCSQALGDVAADVDCDATTPNRYRSFIAGHVAVSVTSAALTCVHHSRLPLYGDVGDDVACGVTLTAAAAAGAGRLMGGKHYSSDVLFGAALGTAAGWLLPSALHYGFGRSERRRSPAARTSATPHISALPMVTGDNVGLNVGLAVVGVF